MTSRPSVRPAPVSYSQWVRQVLARMEPQRDRLVSLFESSVPEPLELLAELVSDSFGGAVTRHYESAFASGNPHVIETLAREYAVAKEQVLSTTGATGALSLLYRALLRPGDRLLVENPGFDLFGILARSYGLGVDTFERSGPRFAIDPETVERAIGPDTRLIVISNLHNPSGFMVSEDVLRALGEIADRHEVYLVVDEVYAPYAGDAAKPAVTLGISPRIISINSLTKIYGLSTLRCGWIVADAKVMEPVRALNREVEFAISKLSHAIAARILEDPDAYRERTAAIVSGARPFIDAYHARWLAEGLVEGELPEHGCIAFPRLVGIEDTGTFSEWLAEERGVIVAPGEYFGAPGHVRLGFGIDAARLELGLEVMTEAMHSYRDARTRAGETRMKQR
ncbi:pyridoxal phosphate-dependent aminotransferase [Pelagerythrobacter marensis]|uniref:Pyridoxal phosphate-dependent aminotransferase n=1 Tax=Pelagerythrobacter marensis TaxID=543877 RepID=A0ABZ2D678_9SPHN